MTNLKEILVRAALVVYRREDDIQTKNGAKVTTDADDISLLQSAFVRNFDLGSDEITHMNIDELLAQIASLEPPHIKKEQALGEQDISNLIMGKQRDMIVRGLQALWRERVTSFNLACDLGHNKGKRLELESFGVPEVEDELRKWGAAPQKY